MPRLLHIDASPHGDDSTSKMLARHFVRAAVPNEVIYHDISREPVPFVTAEWIDAANNPPTAHALAKTEVLALSDRYVDELLAADRILIATPMYNLSIPAVLKAWIDQVVRTGRTLGADGKGLLKDKKLLVIVTSGSPLAGTTYDFVEPYLRAIFTFLGIADISFVHAEGLGSHLADRDKIIADAKARLSSIARTW